MGRIVSDLVHIEITGIAWNADDGGSPEIEDEGTGEKMGSKRQSTADDSFFTEEDHVLGHQNAAATVAA
jgi:hypothetical protein